MRSLVPICVFFCVLSAVTCRGVQESFSWTRLDYQWPRTSRQARTRSSQDKIVFLNDDDSSEENSPPATIPYIFENNIPMGANIWKNKLFITVPRRRIGVPSTLNYILTNTTERHNIPLIPYPDWSTNQPTPSEPNRHHFVSVYRVAVDRCDRLWFVDSGLIETPGNPNQIQPMALIIMDLNTNKILRRHIFNTTVLRPASQLASLTVDIVNDNSCTEAYAYLPDLAGYGLVVYSLARDTSWRVTHNYFFLESTAGEFRIGGHQFQWNDGIFSLALSATKPDGHKDAYFHSMAGFNLYKVSTRILKDQELATRSYHEEDFKIVGHKGKQSQTSASDLDKNTGVLFLGLVNQNAIGCWNIKSAITEIGIVAKDDNRMIYPSDIKVYNGQVIALTNTMPVFLYGRLDYNVSNFRVWTESVAKAVEGTKCAPRRGSSY